MSITKAKKDAEFRRKTRHILLEKYGEDIVDYFFFLKERHRRRSRKKIVVILGDIQENGIDNMYKTCENAGLDLRPFTGNPSIARNRYWKPIIFFFDNQEDINLFRLHFSEIIRLKFNFEEIYQEALGINRT